MMMPLGHLSTESQVLGNLCRAVFQGFWSCWKRPQILSFSSGIPAHRTSLFNLTGALPGGWKWLPKWPFSHTRFSPRAQIKLLSILVWVTWATITSKYKYLSGSTQEKFPSYFPVQYHIPGWHKSFFHAVIPGSRLLEVLSSLTQ